MQHLDRDHCWNIPFGMRPLSFEPGYLAYHRIKPHVPPLVRAPVNSFEFHRCRRTPQVDDLTLSLCPPGLNRPGQLVIIVYCVDYQGI